MNDKSLLVKFLDEVTVCLGLIAERTLTTLHQC